MTIRVTQIVTRLEDADDRKELPAGPDGLWSSKYYQGMTLDEFHNKVPIGCLDDFEIEEAG